MFSKPCPCYAAALICAATFASVSKAEVKLPALLSSHMVLQREKPIHLWGWADPGEQVSVELNGTPASGVADAMGKWSLYLPPQPAGGPFTLRINQTTLDDILIGDVWFASGQSNMEMPLSGFPGSAAVQNGPEEIRNAMNPDLRLFLAPHKTSDYEERDYPGASWTTCTPETASKFSAVAYFFGREIAAHEHVAVGLIDSTWGGTPAEAWMSMRGLSSDASLMPVFSSWADMVERQSDVPAMLAAEKREDDAAKAAGQPPPKHEWHPFPASWGPAELYNGMIAPAVPFAIKGVIWYQGETNSKRDRAYLYNRVFPAMITDWRQHWGEGNFPFLYVQISSFKSNETEIWPLVREAQRRTLRLAHTAMAVTIDIGNPDNVHPADKQDVGARLGLAARALVYGEQVESSGPLFREAVPESDAVRVWFDHANGLNAKGGTVPGFEIAGLDRNFVPATASVEGDTVVVKSPSVADPRYVRYGWANAPTVDLFNSANLPASPFTSEPGLQ